MDPEVCVSVASQNGSTVFSCFALEICLLKYDLTIFKTIQTGGDRTGYPAFKQITTILERFFNLYQSLQLLLQLVR